MYRSFLISSHIHREQVHCCLHFWLLHFERKEKVQCNIFLALLFRKAPRLHFNAVMADEDWEAEVDEQERQITGLVIDKPSNFTSRKHMRKFSVLPVTHWLLLIFSPENSIENRLIKSRRFTHQVTLKRSLNQLIYERVHCSLCTVTACDVSVTSPGNVYAARSKMTCAFHMPIDVHRIQDLNLNVNDRVFPPGWKSA